MTEMEKIKQQIQLYKKQIGELLEEKATKILEIDKQIEEFSSTISVLEKDYREEEDKMQKEFCFS